MTLTRRLRIRFSLMTALMTALIAMTLAAIGLASVVHWHTPRLKRDIQGRVAEDFLAAQRREVTRVLLSYDGSETARVHPSTRVWRS